jgi:hypothetical protein
MPAQESRRAPSNEKGKVPREGGWERKNLFKDLLQSIVVKRVAIETSPANRIKIMA